MYLWQSNQIQLSIRGAVPIIGPKDCEHITGFPYSGTYVFVSDRKLSVICAKCVQSCAYKCECTNCVVMKRATGGLWRDLTRTPDEIKNWFEKF